MSSSSLLKSFVVEVTAFFSTIAISVVYLSVWRAIYPTSRILDQSVLAACIAGLTIYVGFKIVGGAQKFGLVSCSDSQFGWAVSAGVFVSVLFFWMVVNSIDRSNSFFLIHWLGESNSPLDLGEIKSRILSVYSTYDFTAVESRLFEHEKRGIVIREGDEYSLSFSGHLIYQVANSLSKLFSLSGWNSV